MCKKIGECKNNPENSFTKKVGKNIPSAFSMSTISSFKNIENKHDVYISKDCFWSLREHAMRIIRIMQWKEKNWVINKKSARFIWKC